MGSRNWLSWPTKRQWVDAIGVLLSVLVGFAFVAMLQSVGLVK